ncbi:hypothetical protein BGW36DRAFT_364764 [Talaromyces proteolyticus]|uniref:Uncharacterized protein n=1 Tax=Talaromyces proteolyticus TaxID=1131652 RepID=A0AAD4KEG2_9EURO|nr:uncharacterized protein BGW36DRAFT_364764 [Talaromyces proteolyticus]KAH8690033.1 hypothetical protein BGW36DRAFT_364764 [Talaromyces proteolyticus]
MKSILSISLISLLHAGLLSANPVSSPFNKRNDRGSYTASGLGSRKQAITSAGGTTLDLAIAMLETSDMNTDYTYGDGKTEDSANFGIFKQNWFMLRTSASAFEEQSTSSWNDGAVLNFCSSDLSKDIASRHQSQDHYGYDAWFGGHRDGESGVNNPNTDDINTYKSGVEWIQTQIESSSAYLTDDTKFWVDVTPI